MAVYNELQVGRYVRFLQKFFGIKGRQPAPLIYGGEVGTVIPLMHGVENRYLEGWNRFSLNLSFGALAGNQNGYQLRNPPGSAVIVVFEKLYFATGGASLIQSVISTGATTTDLGVVGTMPTARLDPRGNPASSLTSSTQQAAAITDLTNQLAPVFTAIAAGTTASVDLILDENQEVPLLPGDAIRVRTVQQNVSNVVTFMWRERILEESERT